MAKSRRWRFIIKDWDLKQSCLDEIKLTEHEVDAILTLMNKVCVKPTWMMPDKEWNKLKGRRQKNEN